MQQQSEESLWHQQQRLRLTASNFGKVAKRWNTTPVFNLVKSLLYIWQGIQHSHYTVEFDSQRSSVYLYTQLLKDQWYQTTTVSSSELVIDLSNPCLACSPDGLVDIPDTTASRGIVEIKCPYTPAKDRICPRMAAETRGSFFCKVGSDNQIELKRNHNYFYQIQGMLAIAKRSWCDFVVWTPSGLSVQRIEFDAEFWDENKERLVRFTSWLSFPNWLYHTHTQGQPIHDPFLPVMTQ
jgi:hypothetical protein